MIWIKRNKFFTAGVAVAIVLLGLAGWYIWIGLDRNDSAFQRLDAIYRSLDVLTHKHPSPNDNNTKLAQEQERQVREWIRNAKEYFEPIQPIPTVKVGKAEIGAEQFSQALNRTIVELQRDAADSNVLLPDDFSFSFTAERNRMAFASGSLEPLSVQLGEVKAIADILFAARINELDSVQRVRVSADDASGQQVDYLNDTSTTNDIAVITPYQITFRAFSPEIASVLSGFEKSHNGFVVKALNVQKSTGGIGADSTGRTASPTESFSAAASAQITGRGGLQTVLKEQMLLVTMQIDIIRLVSKN